MQISSNKFFTRIRTLKYRQVLSKIVVSILLCTSTVFISIQPVYAVNQNLNNNANELKGESGSLQDLTDVQQQLEGLAESQAQSIQDSINVLKKAIDQDNLEISQHQATIASLDKEQQKLADQQKKDTEALESYVRNQYTEGSIPYFNYVSWLIGSTSIEDLINRCSYIDAILNHYRDLKAEIEANAATIKAKRSSEEDETNKLTTEVQSKQQLLDGLSVALAKQTKLINTLTNDQVQALQAQSRGLDNNNENENLVEAEQLQAQLATQAKYQEMLAAELNSDSVLGTFSTPIKLTGQIGQLLSFASTFLGVPYTWGGTYPQFDCSSYVQYVYGQFGIKLDRVTWDQYKEGQGVSRANLQAGDLVFFSTYQAGPSHVGIYVGDGIMINSSNSGVSYANINSDYWSSRFYGARRVIAQ